MRAPLSVPFFFKQWGGVRKAEQAVSWRAEPTK